MLTTSYTFTWICVVTTNSQLKISKLCATSAWIRYVQILSTQLDEFDLYRSWVLKLRHMLTTFLSITWLIQFLLYLNLIQRRVRAVLPSLKMCLVRFLWCTVQFMLQNDLWNLSFDAISNWRSRLLMSHVFRTKVCPFSASNSYHQRLSNAAEEIHERGTMYKLCRISNRYCLPKLSLCVLSLSVTDIT